MVQVINTCEASYDHRYILFNKFTPTSFILVLGSLLQDIGDVSVFLPALLQYALQTGSSKGDNLHRRTGQ